LLTTLLAVTSLIVFSGCAQSAPVADPGSGSQAWGDQFASCMAAKGWKVKVDSDGGVEGEYTDAQTSAFERDQDTCYNKTSSSKRAPTEQDFKKAYASRVKTRACIVAHGHDLPQAPSYQTFRDGSGQWNPYLDLTDVAYSDLQDLMKACPQEIF